VAIAAARIFGLRLARQAALSGLRVKITAPSDSARLIADTARLAASRWQPTISCRQPVPCMFSIAAVTAGVLFDTRINQFEAGLPFDDRPRAQAIFRLVRYSRADGVNTAFGPITSDF